MADEKKAKPQAAEPVKPQVTPAQVGVAMQECKAPAADDSTQRIRNSLAADKLNSGGTGADVARQARVPENVGQCVADQFKGPNDKKEQSWADRARAVAGDLVDRFTKATDQAVATVKEEIKVISPALVNDVTGGANGKGAVETIREGAGRSGAPQRQP